MAPCAKQMVPCAKEIFPHTKEMVPRMKEMVPCDGNGPPCKANGPAHEGNCSCARRKLFLRAKEIVPAREGNCSCARRKLFLHAKEIVPAREGNSPAHEGNSPAQGGNGPAQRKWSCNAFQSLIETPSQWDRSLLANHGACSAPVQHFFGAFWALFRRSFGANPRPISFGETAHNPLSSFIL